MNFNEITTSLQYNPPTLRQLFNQFTGYTSEAVPPLHIGEDGLDPLLNGLLQVTALPEPVHALTAAYHDGTIFFMFTPFTGQMLHTVLSRLETEGRKRPITLCTYGTITLAVAQQPWLQCLDGTRLHQFKLAVFKSSR